MERISCGGIDYAEKVGGCGVACLLLYGLLLCANERKKQYTVLCNFSFVREPFLCQVKSHEESQLLRIFFCSFFSFLRTMYAYRVMLVQDARVHVFSFCVKRKRRKAENSSAHSF